MFCLKLKVFYHNTLNLDDLEVADCKYGNSFLKTLSQRYPNKTF